jgi:hypothetical protein
MNTNDQYAEVTAALRRAVSAKRETRTHYGVYVRLVAEKEVPLERVVEDLIREEGITRTKANNKAPLIICLGTEVQYKDILEDLLTGNLDFEVALTRVSNRKYQSTNVGEPQPLTPEKAAAIAEADEARRLGQEKKAARAAEEKAAATMVKEATAPVPRASTKMEDEEEAQRCLDRTIMILRQLHTEWTPLDVIAWVMSICNAILKR